MNNPSNIFKTDKPLLTPRQGPTQQQQIFPIQTQADQKIVQFQGRTHHQHRSFYEPGDKSFSFTLLTLETLHKNLDHVDIQQIKYKVCKQIGQGSFGQVFLLNKENSNLYFALKVQKQMNEEEKKILLDLKGIKFKNLVNTIECLYNCFTKEYFTLMEYCEKSLEDVIRQEKLNHQDARYIIKQIANGIRELHEKQIIHRDLKPENILVFSYIDGENTQKTYKICDFGLSSTKQISQTYKCGTSHYMAPEQIQNLSDKARGYNASVDIWALGSVIYELFSGEVLFMGNSNKEVFDLILSIKQENLDEKIKKAIGNLEHVNLVLQMMQIDPQKRITIDEVINKLTKGGTKRINYNKSLNDLQIQFTNNKMIKTFCEEPQQTTGNIWTQQFLQQPQQQTDISYQKARDISYQRGRDIKEALEQQDNHAKAIGIHQALKQQDNHAKAIGIKKDLEQYFNNAKFVVPPPKKQLIKKHPQLL